MKKKLILITVLLFVQVFLVGFAVNTVKLKHEDKGRLMNLSGLGGAKESDEPVVVNPVPNPEPVVTPSPATTPSVTPIVRPTPEPKPYGITLRIRGKEIERIGQPVSLDEVKRIVEDKQITSVKLDCEYGDYIFVNEVINILGEKYDPGEEGADEE